MSETDAYFDYAKLAPRLLTAKRLIDHHGYWRVRLKNHPNARNKFRDYVLEHIAIAAAVLGKTVPKGVEIHHVNGKPLDNRPQNLVICQDSAYHKQLHERMRVRDAGGRPFIDRLCYGCRLVKPIETDFYRRIYRGKRERARYCKSCKNAWLALYKKRRISDGTWPKNWH